MHKGRLPRSYFGAAKYSLVMTFLFIPVRRPLRTAKFGEIGRHAVGGLKNGDLLIASKVRSIRFTDDKWRPHKFRLNKVFLLAARHSANIFALCSRSAASVARFLRYFLIHHKGGFSSSRLGIAQARLALCSRSAASVGGKKWQEILY